MMAAAISDCADQLGANQTSTSPIVMGPESKGPVMTWLSLEHNLLVSLTGVGAAC